MGDGHGIGRKEAVCVKIRKCVITVLLFERPQSQYVQE